MERFGASPRDAVLYGSLFYMGPVSRRLSDGKRPSVATEDGEPNSGLGGLAWHA